MFPKIISGRGIPSEDWIASHSGALDIGLVDAVINQSYISIEREFGDSVSLCCGMATATQDIMVKRVGIRNSSRSFYLLPSSMDISRPSSPGAPPQDLWSSILDSVSSSRSIPSKQVLLLGQPSSGKSTLVSALLQKPLSNDQKDDQRTDFATGYDFADVRDDADEGKCSCLQGAIAMCLMKSYGN